MQWITHKLEDRCANLTCSNKPGEGRFVILAEQPAITVLPRFKKPIVLYVCAPCAAVLRGDQT